MASWPPLNYPVNNKILCHVIIDSTYSCVTADKPINIQLANYTVSVHLVYTSQSKTPEIDYCIAENIGGSKH